jgi:drug/metabolite transporter (DMT)-like permease
MQSFLQLGSAMVMVWVLTFVVERPVHLPQLPITWIALLWLGLLGSCLAYILYFSLIHSIGPTRATTVTYVLPLVGVILGTLFLGERLQWTDLAGGILILSGVVVVNTPGLTDRFVGKLKFNGDRE